MSEFTHEPFDTREPQGKGVPPECERLMMVSEIHLRRASDMSQRAELGVHEENHACGLTRCVFVGFRVPPHLVGTFRY